jgi:pyruvate/2-oxoglutarate dehydrogenase complex dihydrolipoamide dehydrogenase (E3) component
VSSKFDSVHAVEKADAEVYIGHRRFSAPNAVEVDTDPEVPQVGLTPRQARREGIPIDEYRLELANVQRAFINGEEDGFAAIYARRGSGEIVGATPVAAHAGEIVSEITLAIANNLSLEKLAKTVHCYPTQAEAFQRIALECARTRSAVTTTTT